MRDRSVMFVVSSMTIPELLRQNGTDTESFSGIATAFAVYPTPKQGARRRAHGSFYWQSQTQPRGVSTRQLP